MRFKRRNGNKRENNGGTEETCSVMVAPARSKTLLCKLTLRVCIAGSEQEKRRRAGRKGQGKKKQGKQRRGGQGDQEAGGDSVNMRGVVMKERVWGECVCRRRVKSR